MSTRENILLAATFFGATAVVLGAFGAHAFKKILDAERLASFETGVRYQMYHALLLMAVGQLPDVAQGGYGAAAWCIVIGTILFSWSIYLLSFSEYWNKNLRFLGPITPIGGLLLVIGWTLLLLRFVG